MFDNILHQNSIISRLKNDIRNSLLAPSILFSGPEYAGKGTAALELARVLGCEDETNRGNWNCTCSSCKLHRNLVSPDLLLLGKKHFYEETSAAAGAFLRQTDNIGSKMLFIRSVRKLLVRFNNILWEDDPKLGKLRPQIENLEEEVEDIEAYDAAENNDITDEKLEKKCKSIIKKTAKLESDGISALIPINQIRKAAYWCRLAPLGKHKCVIIENAEKMQESAKNSLLKILEEPPPRVTIIITSSRPTILLPTIVSRLREYQFARRSGEAQIELINRIFRENVTVSDKRSVSIESYLSSFLPVKSETLYSLGAFFTASVAAAPYSKKTPIMEDLKSFASGLAHKGGLGQPAADCKNTLAKILSLAEQFEIPGLFKRFLQQCCNVLSSWLLYYDRDSFPGKKESMERTLCIDHWRKEFNQSLLEYETYNISPSVVLEGLYERLKTGMP